MVEHVSSQTEADSKLVGLLAEFQTPEGLVAAAEQVREEGYRRIDAFTPFPVHGLDEALAIRPTILPWVVLGAGLTGVVAALAGQWWTNTIDYPFMISGKPLFSLPANIPVTFEVIILFSAFTAFFGMLVLNGLPRFVQPVFRSERFRRATTDRFFLLVEAADPRFAVEKTRQMLAAAGAAHVEELHDDASPAQTAQVDRLGLGHAGHRGPDPAAVDCAGSSRPVGPAALAHVHGHGLPAESQAADGFDAVRRRPGGPVAGRRDRGPRPIAGRRAAVPRHRSGRRTAQAGTKTGAETGERSRIPASRERPAAPAASSEPAVAWVKDFPLPVTAELMKRGRQRFNVYCAPCHGLAGEGDGLVARRAAELQQGTWVPPTSLHSEAVRPQPVGQLFNTISNGVRKMPAYGSQISVPDRWAIVLYVRALQRTQNAKPADVPPETLKALEP